jgi:CheY-like chemotaxis protein
VQEAPPLETDAFQLVNEVGDDRASIQTGDRVLLVVENDVPFSRLLLDAGREAGFKVLVTSLGAVALTLAREFKPDALTLDIFLPDIEGWRVLERLKNDVQTRHIPVCVISTEEARVRALRSGALAFVPKPIETRQTVDRLLDALRAFAGRDKKRLLVVEPDAPRRQAIAESVDGDDIAVSGAATAEETLRALRELPVDCVVLGQALPELSVAALAEAAGRDPAVGPLPVVLYGDGYPADEGDWKQLAEACIVRRVHSLERLLDQSAFFLHRHVAKLSEPKRRILEDLHATDKVLPGKKVLIVDDDMRNIFALSTVLEEHEMVIVSADNGRDAIKALQAERDVDIVLMDIMMPEMDGIDTMREIRKIPQLQRLPIIAVTAKAMKGDREKCIEAGAWDYLAKPVETEQMLAVLRAWLHR